MWRSKVAQLVAVVAVVIAGLAGSAVLGVLPLHLSTAHSASLEPWPPFTMVYEDWQWNRGPNNTPGHVTVRVTYNGLRDWKNEILEDTSAPNLAGSWSSFVGTTASSHNTRFGTTSSYQVDPADVNFLADWLTPTRIAGLKRAAHTFTRPTSTPGVSELVWTLDLPCQPIVACKGSTFQDQTQIQYRQYPGYAELPFGLVETRDGSTVIRRVTVSDFRLLPKSQS